MSEQAIKILIVDDNEKTRDKLIEQLRFEDVAVVGESSFGAAAYTWAQQLEVDVVIVSIEEPIARSLRTIESLAVGTRSWPVLGLSSQTDRETMRKAVVAGVRDYLVWPVADEELHQTIVNIHRTEQSRRSALAQGQTAGRVGTIVAVVGVKGGIGKSTVAANVAIALAEQTRQQIAMVDLDLQFGDAAVMLDLLPARTIEQAAKELTGANPQLIQDYLTDHASRVKLLAAPATPEGAETITEDQVGEMLGALAATNDYVVVDTSAQIDGISMRVMDMATLVLLVVVPEVPCVRRTRGGPGADAGVGILPRQSQTGRQPRAEEERSPPRRDRKRPPVPGLRPDPGRSRGGQRDFARRPCRPLGAEERGRAGLHRARPGAGRASEAAPPARPLPAQGEPRRSGRTAATSARRWPSPDRPRRSRTRRRRARTFAAHDGPDLPRPAGAANLYTLTPTDRAQRRHQWPCR